MEWQALEQIEKQNAEWQQQQAVEQEMREMLLLQLPVQAEQAQPSEWMPVQQEPAAAPDLQQQEMPGAGGQEGGEAAQLAAELAALPSPINANTSDLDAAVARLLASAGHTPTGPLGLGMRGVPADRGMGQAAVAEKCEPALMGFGLLEKLACVGFTLEPQLNPLLTTQLLLYCMPPRCCS